MGPSDQVGEPGLGLGKNSHQREISRTTQNMMLDKREEKGNALPPVTKTYQHCHERRKTGLPAYDRTMTTGVQTGLGRAQSTDDRSCQDIGHVIWTSAVDDLNMEGERKGPWLLMQLSKRA